MGVNFTDEQKKVIQLRDRNILVSAAAGSGKTAVLVERIITRLTKDNPMLNVDELLVLTYTDAAASEMKERVLGAIEKALEEEPENVHLQQQATLIYQAQITTIHKFCMSVIRDYFHTIDLDPSFRIGEEGELKLLKADVLDEVLAYQVDQISDMIDKDDTEALQEALAVKEGEDKVTLFTCTPYGVNSHRLLVRGTRVPYNGEEHVEMTIPETMVQSVQNYYMIYLILGISITLLAIVIMKYMFKRNDNRKKS